MEATIRSARAAGVFKSFHVLTDAPIDGCECYDGSCLDMVGGLHKLSALKAGIAKLNYEYFVWIEPGSQFRHNPPDPIRALSRSPIHVPLETPRPLDSSSSSLIAIENLLAQCGVRRPIYQTGGEFWIVARTAVDTVCELASFLWQTAKKHDISPNAPMALAYCMQMLCAFPQKHTIEANSELWSPGPLNPPQSTAAIVYPRVAESHGAA